MTQSGKVHFLTSIPGRNEVHLLGNADLTSSFKVLKQQLANVWGIDDMSECVLEYTGPLLESPTKAIIIGTDEEWTFARDRLCKLADAQPASTAVAVVKSGYDASTGKCTSCGQNYGSGRQTCGYCSAKAIVPVTAEPVKPMEPVPVLVRFKPPKPTKTE